MVGPNPIWLAYLRWERMPCDGGRDIMMCLQAKNTQGYQKLEQERRDPPIKASKGI